MEEAIDLRDWYGATRKRSPTMKQRRRGGGRQRGRGREREREDRRENIGVM